MSVLEATAVAPRTVIEACFDRAGVAELDVVYAVGQAVGLADQAVRLAIRRLEAAGQLVQTGRGRKGRLSLTASARAHTARERGYLAFAHAQDEGRIAWDGLWRLILFSISETRRTERDALRNALTSLGAAPLIPGAYLSPHDLREDLVAALGVVPEHTFLETETLEVPGADDAPAIVATLWPLAEIRAAYEPLATALDELDAQEEEAAPDVAEIATALRLAELFTRGMEADPLLPPEILDNDWPPVRTRRRFRHRWTRLRESGPELRLFQLLEA